MLAKLETIAMVLDGIPMPRPVVRGKGERA